MPIRPIKIFISYAHLDEAHRVLLGKHLSPLVHSGSVELWCDRRIEPGQEWGPEIDAHLEEADLILLMISANFMASNYCWQHEMHRALKRHQEGSARVIPLFLRHTYFRETPIGALQGLPLDARPVEGWPSLDEAYTHIAEELSRLVASWDEARRIRQAEPKHVFDRERYLHAFIRRMEQLDSHTSFLTDSFVEPTKDIAGPGEDLSTDIAETPPVAPRSGHKRRSIKQTRDSVSKMLGHDQLQRILVLLGEPGSGKSLLLRRLARELAAEALRDPQAPIPGYFSLGAYTQSRNGRPVPAIDFIQSSLANGSEDERGLAPELKSALATGRMLLLLDGMDEMPRSDFEARVEELRGLSNDYLLARVIFACRTNDLPRSRFTAQQIRLVPFGAKEVQRFLSLALKLTDDEAKALTTRLREPTSKLSGLVSNPFFLMLVAQHYKNWREVPESHAALFQSFIESHINRVLVRHPGVTLKQMLRQLSDFSLAMLVESKGGIGTAVPVSSLLARTGMAPQQGALLVTIGQEAGLLRRDGVTGALRFLHASLQEFFVAQALEWMDPAARENWLTGHIDDSWLQEVFVLVAQREVDLVRFFYKVLDDTERALLDTQELEDDYRRSARLILLGRMLEASSSQQAKAVIDRMAALLERLMASAHEQPFPELRRIRTLRAIRGPLVGVPALSRFLEEAIALPKGLEQEEAFKRLAHVAGTHAPIRQRIIGYVRREAIHGDYLLSFPRLRKIAVDEPHLAFVRKELLRGLFLHLVFALAVIGLWILLSYATWDSHGWIFPTISLLYLTPELRRVRSLGGNFRSSLVFHLTALLLVAGVVLGWMATRAGIEWGKRLLQPGEQPWSAVLFVQALNPREPAAYGVLAATVGLFVVSAFSTLRARLSPGRIGILGALGAALVTLILLAAESTAHHLPGLWGLMLKGALILALLSIMGIGVALLRSLLRDLLRDTKELFRSLQQVFQDVLNALRNHSTSLVLPIPIGMAMGYGLLREWLTVGWSEALRRGLTDMASPGVLAVGALSGLGLCVLCIIAWYRTRTRASRLFPVLGVLGLVSIWEFAEVFSACSPWTVPGLRGWHIAATTLIAILISKAIPYFGAFLLGSIVGIFVGIFSSSLFRPFVAFLGGALTGGWASFLLSSTAGSPIQLRHIKDMLRIFESRYTADFLRGALAERMGMLDPPSEVLVIALMMLGSTTREIVEREGIGRAVDNLQQRLNQEPLRSLHDRLQRELPVLAMLESVISPDFYRLVCKLWAYRAAISPEALASLEQDTTYGKQIAALKQKLLEQGPEDAPRESPEPQAPGA